MSWCVFQLCCFVFSRKTPLSTTEVSAIGVHVTEPKSLLVFLAIKVCGRTEKIPDSSHRHVDVGPCGNVDISHLSGAPELPSPASASAALILKCATVVFSSPSRPSNREITADITSDGLLLDRGCAWCTRDLVCCSRLALVEDEAAEAIPPPSSLRCSASDSGQRQDSRRSLSRENVAARPQPIWKTSVSTTGRIYQTRLNLVPRNILWRL